MDFAQRTIEIARRGDAVDELIWCEQTPASFAKFGLPAKQSVILRRWSPLSKNPLSLTKPTRLERD